MSARATAVVILAVLFALPAATPGPVEAQPGPEQKKLDFFIGKWRNDTEVKASASVPASKASGTDECEWFANMHVVCRGETTGAAGLYRAMRVISYVPAMKQYASYTVDSLGYAVFSMGQVQGSTWTFATDLAGVKTRYVVKGGKDGYSAVSEWAGADGKWTTTSETKATKMK